METFNVMRHWYDKSDDSLSKTFHPPSSLDGSTLRSITVWKKTKQNIIKLEGCKCKRALFGHRHICAARTQFKSLFISDSFCFSFQLLRRPAKTVSTQVWLNWQQHSSQKKKKTFWIEKNQIKGLLWRRHCWAAAWKEERKNLSRIQRAVVCCWWYDVSVAQTPEQKKQELEEPTSP